MTRAASRLRLRSQVHQFNFLQHSWDPKIYKKASPTHPQQKLKFLRKRNNKEPRDEQLSMKSERMIIRSSHLQ